MDTEKAKLLIRAASKMDDEQDRKAILELAEQFLNDKAVYSSKDESYLLKFPINIKRTYKGRRYEALLFNDARVQYQGKLYNTPSAAAFIISGHNENGWRTWKYYDEATNKLEPIKKLEDDGKMEWCK